MPADTSSEKKLKQSRLPFSPVDPKTQKKRKLSAESEIRSPKLLCAGSASTSKRSDEIKTEKSNVETFDKNVSKTTEEKENIKTKVLDPQFLGGEESNDSIEIVAVKENVKKAPALDSKSPEQQDKISAPKGKIKRKRSSSVKAAASSNTIKKMFKEVEVKQVVSPASKIAKIECENEPDSKKLELKGKKTDNPLKDKDGMTCKDENLENKNESIKDTNTSTISLTSDDEGSIKVESEKDSNTNTTNSSPSPLEADSETEKIKTMTVKTPVPKKAVTCMKKLTLKQNQQRELSMKKKEEMVKLKLEKEKLKKEKEVEKQIQKEERQKKKIEEQEAKDKEKEEKKQKKEEERLKKEEERLKKEEERLKKEEEKQKKEEERQRKEEEKLQAEEEEKEKRKKLQKKFAQFFVPKKVEETSSQKETVVSADNFVHFRVKENMKIAPLVRTTLSNEKKRKLEDYLNGESEGKTVNYLKEIKKSDYICEKSCRTFPPPDENNDEDDCEIISDEEIDGTDVLEVKSSQTQTIRAKLLQFCENSRPAYYGTWSKKPKNLSGRKPLAKEEIFDYDYDSDEDWEDIENGESLSDSDGEGDDGGKDEGNQYEVDNDFFVPHGYLSEGEGEEDEDTEAVQKEGDQEKEKDEDMQKEKLKQKQEEFELEMKQQTRHLKPKVFGCVWLGDKSSHQAYDQLLKLLLPHRSIVMFGTCPIDVSSKISNQDLKDDEDDDETTKKFVKSFPESAVPDLIRLIHGNRHSKLFLMREFHEYWKNKREEVETDPSNSGWIALRKIEPKIQEIGQYGRFTENGISYKCRTWYVSKEVREKYGMEDLNFQNSWTYTLPVKENKREDPKEDKQDDQNEEQGSKTQLKSPFTGTNLITKFTKVVTDEEEKRKNFSVGCQSPSISDMKSPDVKTPKATSSAVKTPKGTSSPGKTPKATSKAVKTPKATSKAVKTPKATSSTNKTPKAISSTGKTPRPPSSATKNLLSTPLSSGKKTKSRTNLDTIIKEKTETTKPKNSIMAMFKNMEKGKKGAGNTSTQDKNNDEDPGCITLD